jgi:signal transduction histidine kinase
MPACGTSWRAGKCAGRHIGNLLRNAIENSDRGKIRVRPLADATVIIEDPATALPPEEISDLCARGARCKA